MWTGMCYGRSYENELRSYSEIKQKNLNSNPMADNHLMIKCKEYLKLLCEDITERCVGSNGNRQATRFMQKELSLQEWETEMGEFEAMDWEENGASLKSDGDFNIPSVYMTEEEGSKLISRIGKIVFLDSRSRRIPGKGYNVIGKKGNNTSAKIVVTAHIDAKKGTPGAIDNATGVIVLLLLSDLLKDYKGNKLIEIVTFNGEDYYAAPGQMNYISVNKNKFDNILLNINIDGAGYKEGLTAFSFYNLPDEILYVAKKVINHFSGITEDIQWPQGDHSIFVQAGVPAIAVSSKWLIDNISYQDITHTEKDNIGIVDCNKIVEISQALNTLIRSL